MKKFAVIEKKVGQTPLDCMELWRNSVNISRDVPLAYAGRLDPMASGKLLVLIGDECKKQTDYHGLDKTYEFEILFGVKSDSGDVLGLISECTTLTLTESKLINATKKFTGLVSFPYPKFSSKTVQGKPLHTWTLEGRIDDIVIPTYTSTIYNLKLLSTKTITREEVHAVASKKIESLPPVTDERKAIGNDFRRPHVRETWLKFKNSQSADAFTIAKFSCACSSGTYMRTLAEEIAKSLDTCGLAYSIHRTTVGMYQPLIFGTGFWKRKY